MRAALLLLLVACGAVDVSVEQAPLSVHSWLEQTTERGGVLVVQITFDPDGEVDLPAPEVKGLTFEAVAEPGIERVGSRDVSTQRYSYSGGKGMYKIPPLRALWRGDDDAAEAASSPLFIDIATEAPREGEPEDIVEPSRIIQIPWGWFGAAAGGFAVLAAGIFLAFGRTGSKKEAVLPADPPDVAALRAWEAVRSDPTLDDQERALAISRIFREYAGVVLGFSATAWTTTEILAHLRGLAHLPEGNVPRARRLLRATDRVKFADHKPGTDLFEDLDADLRAFVGTTRPHQWTGGEKT